MGLRCFVYVQDGHGDSVGFGPGDAVPAWAAAQITNPKVWADGDAPAAATVIPDPASSTAATPPAVQDVPGDVAAPPRNGPGSSRDAWAAYATSIGIDVKPGTTKADIIAEVESARTAG